MLHRRKTTIVSKIIIPLLATVLAQSVLIVGILTLNGVFEQLRENALSMLSERTQNKHQNLQTDMTQNWTSLASTKEKVNTLVAAVLKNRGEVYADIASDADLNAALSRAVAGELVSRIRSNDTTGVFVIWNGIGVAGDPDTVAGVYIRDADPLTDAPDNDDLFLFRGLPPLSRTLDMSLDSYWEASFRFPGQASDTANDFYYQPLLAAQQGLIGNDQHEGYWARPFLLNSLGSGEVVTYSEPLISAGGEVYGVIGVELSVSYLGTVLSKGDFVRSNRGCYFLGVTTDGGETYWKVVTGGAKYKQYFHSEDDALFPDAPVENARLRVRSTRGDEMLRGAVYNLMLYPASTVFASQQWALIGLEDETTLFAFLQSVRSLILLGAALAVVFGSAVAVLAGRGLVKPVIRLVNSLRESDPNEELVLESTQIVEIDRLAEAIMALHRDVTQSATRLSKILRLSGLPVGVFEIREDSDIAYCSDDVFTLLGNDDADPHSNQVPCDVCRGLVERAMAEPVEESVYRLHLPDGERYVRIRRMADAHGMVGTILDVTDEMRKRLRIERERDHDLLTGILNRRAFESHAEALFIKGGAALGVAAMVMFDLDNLKYLNDTYGHDCGDGYIRAFADALLLFGQDRVLMARRSGDEFYAFLYGAKNQAEIRRRIEQVWRSIAERPFPLPDGTPYRIQASAGVAWYPTDAKALNQLIHYADFAMYKAKHGIKGTVEEFSVAGYNDDLFLAGGREALDRLIEQQTIRFAVQPVLSADTGDVFAYELQMRTNMRELPDRSAVLRIAAAEGRLDQIERLTILKGLESVQFMLTNRTMPTGVFFFLHTIPGVKMSAQDEQVLSERYGHLLPRLVISITEQEVHSPDCLRQKLIYIREHGARIAIHEYGSGPDSALALEQTGAEIVKLDMACVHSIDTDGDKQARVRALMTLAREHRAAVLAQGVETREEMRTLIRLGVDYLQGFFLGQPQYRPLNVDKQLKREIRRAVEGTEDASDGGPES